MKKTLALFLLMILVLGGCSKDVQPQEQSEEKTVINVSAAASLKGALTDIETIYEADHPEYEIMFNFGGSGALQAQIEEGAPVDIFFSAGSKQVNALEGKDLIVNESRKSFLRNSLVVITPSESKLLPKEIKDLAEEDFAKIGHADPALAPAGQYATEAINYYNLKDQLGSKTVLSPDVKTTLTWVEAGEVDAGFVYMTDAMTTDKVKVGFTVDRASHSPIEYPAAIIKDSSNPQGASQLMDFMSAQQSLDIFQKYGFSIEGKEIG